MPKEVFLAVFGGKRAAVSWHELFELKRDFGISIAAIMARARNLGLITENYYIRFNVALNTRGWRNPEPVEFPGQEQSNRFELMLTGQPRVRNPWPGQRPATALVETSRMSF
jgi:Zn-dependent peptidase ImmA (M78 family)